MRRTIVLMEPRCSPRLPALLLPSCPPPPPCPWQNCCIAADVISCFLTGISALRSTPHRQLTVQRLPLSLFARVHLNTIALHSSSSSPCMSFHTVPLQLSYRLSVFHTDTFLLVLPCSSYPPPPSISFCVRCANCAIVLFPLLSL